jgi:hypothetical protein
VSRLRRDPQVEELVAAYRADLEDAGQYAEKEVTSPARSFLLRVGVEGWARRSLDEQLAPEPKEPPRADEPDAAEAPQPAREPV